MRAITAWRGYWEAFGIPYGLFQAFMAAVLVISGTGLILGLAWMIALTWF
jgi:hypothetical protein